MIKRSYEILVEMWNNKEIPEFMKWRWICLLPKVPNSLSPSDLRPITLVEILRKLWSGFFVNKVRDSVNKFSLISANQFGYTKWKGTDMLSVVLANALEQASEQNLNIALSSWDKKRAFCSVSKNVSKIALRRIGLPVDLINYLVGLDINGTTIIRSDITTDKFEASKRKAHQNNQSYTQTVKKEKFMA